MQKGRSVSTTFWQMKIALFLDLKIWHQGKRLGNSLWDWRAAARKQIFNPSLHSPLLSFVQFWGIQEHYHTMVSWERLLVRYDIWDTGCGGRRDVIRQHKDVRGWKKRRSTTTKSGWRMTAWAHSDNVIYIWERWRHTCDDDSVIMMTICYWAGIKIAS